MKKILGKNRLFLMLFVAMIFALSFASLSGAADAVPYLDADGKTQSCSDYTVVTEEMTVLENGWYVVSSSVTISEKITVTGDVKLILADGATLTVNGGIIVNEKNIFTVFAQSNGDNMGKLIVKNTVENNAGIGGSQNAAGGVITINGGDVTSTGGDGGAGIGCGASSIGATVTINGGIVTATGGSSGPGIGGGAVSDCGYITINGGVVNAIGGFGTVGIGFGPMGFYGGGSWINGGTVTVIGEEKAFSEYPSLKGGVNFRISSGKTLESLKDVLHTQKNTSIYTSNCAVKVTICDSHETISTPKDETNHSNVCKWCGNSTDVKHAMSETAQKDGENHTLGCKDCGYTVDVAHTITGTQKDENTHTVSCKDCGYTADVAHTVKEVQKDENTHTASCDTCGYTADVPHNFFSTYKDELNHTSSCDDCGYSKDEAHSLGESGNCVCGYEGIKYLEYNAETGDFYAKNVIAQYITSSDTELVAGWYVADGNITVNSRVTISGDVKLILADGASLIVNGGIGVDEGNSITIYAQSESDDMGKLIAQNCDDMYVAIGSTESNVNGDITINGGNITATVSAETVAIGGVLTCGVITINGGVVSAKSSGGHAAIGALNMDDSSVITINGGVVSAEAIKDAAIGANMFFLRSGTVNIFGGSITAKSSARCAIYAGEINFKDGVYFHTKAGESLDKLNDIPYPAYMISIYTTNSVVKIDVCESHAESFVFKDSNVHSHECRWCGFSLGNDAAHNFDDDGVCECGYTQGVAYLDYNYQTGKFENKTTSAVMLDSTMITLTSGWYVVSGSMTIDNRMVILGDVNIILADGAELKNGGISVCDDNSLTLYAQSNGDNMGKLTADCYIKSAATIGGDGIFISCGTITINGGNITANKHHQNGSAIGGGDSGANGAITINGGVVFANAENSYFCVGIGSEYQNVGGNLTINGGVVTAIGNSYTHGIVGFSDNGGVKINGGIVTVKGGRAFEKAPMLDSEHYISAFTGDDLDDLKAVSPETCNYSDKTVRIEITKLPKNVNFLSVDGFQLRMTQYNGLRTRYVVDLNMFNDIIDAGCTVVEYGTLVSAASKLASGEMPTISKNSEGNYAAQSFVQKIAVYDSENGYKEKYTEMTEEQIVYYVTVTKFDIDTYAREIVARGYMVVSDSVGNEYVIYADYPNEAYRSISLKKLCEDMAAAGSLSAEECISYSDVLSFNAGGFQTVSGNKYYYRDGVRVTGWQDIDGGRYYFDPNENGKLVTWHGDYSGYRFTHIEGKTYCIGVDGRMDTGWKSDYIGARFFFDLTDGHMLKEEWLELNGKKYYFGSTGEMYYGYTYEIDGVEYKFDMDGVLVEQD